MNQAAQSARSAAFLLFCLGGLNSFAASQVAVTSSANPSTYGASVTLTATVSPSTATGKVTFYDGTTVLGTGTLASGAATLKTILLPAGAQSLTAYYGGDNSNGSATSPAISQTVNANPGNDFAGAVSYSAGSYPYGIVVADFNGDGKQDVAVPDYYGNGVSVLLGNGDGTFQAAVFYSSSQSYGSPQFLAVGDFNGDGNPDLAVAAAGGDTVGILLGNGDGTFQQVVQYSSTGYPSGLAIGDFNGDGIADIAAVNDDSTVSVLLGNGDGTFQAAVSYGAPPSCACYVFAIGAGDFNGDGKADLAVAGNSNLLVLLGNGDGTFQPAIATAANTTYYDSSLIVADLNGDGKADVAFPVYSGIAVLLGNGDGTFQPVESYELTDVYGIAAGDFNGDGKIDIATSGYYYSQGLASVLLGNGDGTFQNPVSYFAGEGAYALAVGDFNGDGRVDLAVANATYAYSGDISVLLAIDATGLLPTSTLLTSSSNPTTFGQSITLTAAVSPTSATGTVTFLDGTTTLGTGTLSGGTTSLTITTLGVGLHSLTAAYGGDSNGGGSTSATLSETVNQAATTTALSSSPNPSNAGQTVILRATVEPSFATGMVTFMDGSNSIGAGTLSGGTATLTVSTLSTGTHSLTAVYPGDANDTASTSPALTQTVYASRTPTTTSLLSSLNPSTFGKSVTLTASVSPSSATGTVTFYDGVTVLETEPLAAGQAALKTTLLASGARSITAYYSGDPNNSPSTSTAIAQQVNAVAGGDFASPVSYAAGSYPYGIAVGDFNGDGKADLAVLNEDDTTVSVFIGNGDGTFQAAEVYGAGQTYSYPESLALGDFNGDGKMDIAVADESYPSSNITVLLGNGDGTFQPGVQYTGAPYPTGIVVGDFNGDGTADIASAGENGVVGIMLGNGDGTFQPPTSYGSPIPYYYQFTIATGDFNGDGKPDLAVLGNDTLAILLGNGDGSFQSPTSLGVNANYTVSMVVADLNGDGKADVAYVNSYGITVLLGNGDGTFQVPVNYGNLESVNGIAAGDFNGDGKIDLATTSYSYNTATGNLSIFLGNGDGTFRSPASFAAGSEPFELAASDFNGDGIADIVDTNTYNDNVSVLLGLGATGGLFPTNTAVSSSSNPSTFGQSITLTASVSPTNATGTVTFMDGTTSLGTGTLNSFGTTSLTLSTLSVGSHSLTAVYGGDSIHLGSTSSALTQTVNPAITTTTLTSSVNPANLGQTVTLRASVQPSTATGTITFMDGSTSLGTGTLSSGTASLAISTLSAGTHALTAVYGGDVNDSGGTSAVLTETVYGARTTTTTTLTPSLNPSTYGASVTFTASVSPGSPTGTIAFYDGVMLLETEPIAAGQAAFKTTLLASGARSISAYYSGDANNSPSTSSALIQQVNAVSGGDFDAPVTYQVGANPISAVVADVNQDGKDDLVVWGIGAGLSVMLGNGDGTFQTPVQVLSNYPSSVAVGDFNGDGKPDIAFSDYNTVGILLNNGNGTFAAPVEYAAGAIDAILLVGDFNGDGTADVAAFGQNETLTIFLGNGDGTLGAGSNSTPAVSGNFTFAVAQGDFNNDGKVDLALIGNSTSAILLGNGDGTFTPAPANSTPIAGESVVALDLNGDGKTDLAVADGNGFDVFLGNGDGTFQAPTSYFGSGGYGGNGIAAGDFNGDGKTDLVVTGSSEYDYLASGIAGIFLGNGDGAFQTVVNFAVGPQPGAPVLADFNGDGRFDIAVTNNQSSTLTVLLGEGLTGGLAPTQTDLSSSPNPSTFGSNVSLIVLISPSTATGTVNFQDGSTTLGTPTLSGGSATLNISTLAVGAHSITAAYSGDANDAASTSAVLTQTVNVANTATSLSSSLNPANIGQTVNLRATLQPSTATGTVTFFDGSTSLGTGTLSGGTTTLAISTLAAGSHSLTAVYGGDADDSGSTSAVLTETVFASRTATVTSLVSSSNPAVYGSGVTLTASVSPSSATGEITFYDGVTVLESEPVSSGQAQLKTTLLAAGARPLTAYYSGDSNNSPSVSTVLTQQVNAVAGNDFGLASAYAVGTYPYLSAVADFNNDGKPDLLVIGNSQNPSLLLGNGDGTFQPAVSITANQYPNGMAIGDFNGDGNPDIALSDYDGVEVLLGNGDGTFQAPVQYQSNQYETSSVAAADFNGDGKTDLVAIDGNGFLSVFIGNGDGTFQPALNYATGTSSYISTIAVGDFNGDGRADLAIVGTYGYTLTIVLGNGDGSFQPPVYSTGIAIDFSQYSDAFVALDLNGDGKTDLAIPGDGGVLVLLGNGDGTFQPPVNYGDLYYYGTFGIASGDFNGDGKPDLAVTNYGSATGEADILIGNGDGTFQNPVGYSVGSQPYSLVVADFNGDGRADIATVNNGGSNVSILLATTATGQLPTTVSLTANPSPSAFSQTVELTAQVSPTSATGTVTFLDGSSTLGTVGLNDGVAVLDISTLTVGGHSLKAAYSGDSNDLPGASAILIDTVTPANPGITLSASPNPANAGQTVTLRVTMQPATASGTVSFLDGSTVLGAGTLSGGTATLAVSTFTAGIHSLTVSYPGDADDNPGTSAVLTETVYQTRTSTATTLSSSGSPSTYGASVTLTASVSPSAATGSVAFYDGVTLLGTAPLSAGQSGLKTILLASGARSLTARYSGDANDSPSVSPSVTQQVNAAVGTGFATPVSYGVGTEPYGVAVADFNGDGLPDLAVINEFGGNVSLLLGNGDGTFQPALSIAGENSSELSIAVGDFNGDGHPDLAVGGGAGLAVLLGNGDGTFQAAVEYATGGAALSGLVVGDFNGDGKADLAAICENGVLNVFTGNGDGTFQATGNYGTALDFNTQFDLASGDFNGDGKADLAILGNGTVFVLLGNGDGTFQPEPEYSTGLSGASIVSLDLNGDGKTDLAVADGSAVNILLGNGDGTFQPPASYSGGALGYSNAIAPADFNGDGKPDLVTTSFNGYGAAGFANIFIGNGDGTFQPALSYPAGNQPYALAVGDFNGDGRADLAVPSYTGNDVSILLATNKCVTLSPTSIATDSTGGTPVTLTLTASSSSCSWNASANASWIQISPASGTGSGTVTATIAPNSTGADRSGQIDINGSVVAVSQAFTAQVFADVIPSEYYFDAVNLMSTHNITAGCSVTPFDYCPTQQIDRAEMAIFIVRAVYNGSNSFPYSPTPHFSDVPANYFAFAWIQAMYELGITTGCGNGMFCPTDTVTRGEMAVFIIRARYGSNTAFTSPSTPYFSDVPASNVFFTYIQRMKEDNITAGCSATTYCPNSPVIRGDMAIFVMRGAFNQLLPPGEPVIASIVPGTLTAGTSATYTVTGINTNFVQGTTTVVPVDAGAVTASNITVISPTTLTVTLTATSGASQQPVSIYVQTEPQEAVLPNGLTVQ